MSYSWKWGDGSADSSGVSPTHTFTAPGTYNVTLTVTDNYGLSSAPTTQSTEVSGEVAKIPTVTKQPANVELVEGGEATLEAAASGVPAPTVQWEVSTDKGVSWSAVTGAISDTLKVVGVKTSESGDEYRAVFTNKAGKADSNAATLTVNAVPKVSKQPLSVELLEGEEATLEAAASGVPAPTVQWEVSTDKGVSWSAVTGAISDTLKVSGVKTSESGDEYRAVFTNKAGKADSNAATLTVNAVPKVSKQPLSVELLEGEEATLEAAASGVPAPTVQWEVSTDKGVSWSAVTGAISDTLKVSGVKTSESGDEYRAVFTNKAGKADSNAATLTVNAVPRVTKQPLSVELLEGEEATLEAAASGVPAPTVQWEVSTDKGVSWSAVTGAISDTLKVSGVKTSESGDEYRAVFTNKAGKADSNAATLTVGKEAVAPEVSKQPLSVELLEGEEATLEAAASGVPAPTVQWELSTDKGVSWSTVTGATSDTLNVSGVKTSESGDEYRAVFTNKAGKADSNAATLTVGKEAVAPEVSKQPLSVELLEGEEATLEAAASGVPAPTVQWELSTDKGVSWSTVTDATSDTLNVSSVKASESGDEYRAAFTNMAAKADSNPATLTVKMDKHEDEQEAAATKKREEEKSPLTASLGEVAGFDDAVTPPVPYAQLAGTYLQASAAGAVSLKITCPAGESSCEGTVTLRTLNAISASVGGAGKKKASVLTLTTGSFAVPGGEVKTVTLRLSRTARTLLARWHVLRVRTTIVAHDSAGATHTWQTIATLRAPKVKHGKG